MKGPAIAGARPTSELVRGAIFNVLGPLQPEQVRVLDLFAGTGSLGIEALSRGARWADLVEQSPRQCARIRENLSLTGLSERAAVHCMEVERALGRLEGPYQLVLMDPPYKMESLDSVLGPLATSTILEPGTRVVVGHSKRTLLQSSYHRLEHRETRRYGDSVVDFYEREA